VISPTKNRKYLSVLNLVPSISTGRSNKCFFKQNVNFQKKRLLPQNNKNQKKSTKEISMRDHGENKKIPKKCMLFYVSKPRGIIPQENKQNKKNL